MDNIDLSDLFTTKVEANDFLSRLTTVSEMFFQTGFNLENALMTHFGVNKSDLILTILRQNNINPESLPAVKDFFFILMSKISALPVLSLTIAFEPQSQTLKTLSEWFFINMHKQMLFELNVDSNIIGGAHITYNGKFFDFSVRSTFDRILKNYMTRLAHPDAHIPPKPFAQLPVSPTVNQTTTPATHQPVSPQPVTGQNVPQHPAASHPILPPLPTTAQPNTNTNTNLGG